MRSAFAAACCLLLITTVGLRLDAQSNEVIDELLEQEQARYGQAVYLVLVAVELLPEDAIEEEAIEMLEQTGWGIPIKAPEETILLGEYAFLVMKALDMPGGVMYAAFPGPRYASRELNYRRITLGRNNPYKTLSGTEVVSILGRAMRWKERNL
jgi:hypothetical protein